MYANRIKKKYKMKQKYEQIKQEKNYTRIELKKLKLNKKYVKNITVKLNTIEQKSMYKNKTKSTKLQEKENLFKQATSQNLSF